MKALGLNQPKGLFLLFFTELWERFGFYTLQTIIVLYMTKSMLYSDDQAYLLYGAFSSMLYLTPVLGGYLADRVLGFRNAIYLGGLLFIAGYLLIAIPSEKSFFLGLGFIIIANGLFKPNVSSIVGELYSADDPRRDSGFTLFYMGINIGSLFPPLITGFLVTKYGWHTGFLLAAGGICIGLITFFSGRKRLGEAGLMPSISPLLQNARFKWCFSIALGIALAITLIHFVFYIPKQADLILIILCGLFLIGIFYFLHKEHGDARRKMIASLILILISIGFWALYNQTFTTLMLFADRNMSKQFLGFTIDAEFTQFFNPFFIIILSPILSWFWVWLDQRDRNPSTPMKFSLAVLCMAFGFLFLGGATALFSPSGLSSPDWLAGSYLFQTIGELLLSPIGLAMITRLAPRHLVGMMMGVWFLTQSVSFAIGGFLATLASVPSQATLPESLAIYSHAFLIYGAISAVLALISLTLVPFLKKLIS